VPAHDRVAYGPYYLWGHRSLLDNVAGGEFGNKANALGLDFSLRAIRAQPRFRAAHRRPVRPARKRRDDPARCYLTAGQSGQAPDLRP
jgi:hypothetical protein